MNALAWTVKAPTYDTAKTVNCSHSNEFDHYIKEKLFPIELYDLLDKTHDYRDNRHDFIAASKQPDFRFRAKSSGIEFFAEARYRARFQNQVLEWAKFFQLKYFQEIDNITPVLIAIGLGGRPEKPERVFLVPVKHVKFVKLYPGFLQKYELYPDRHVSERYLKVIL